MFFLTHFITIDPNFLGHTSNYIMLTHLTQRYMTGGGNSHIFWYFHPEPWKKWSNLTHIFQTGWFNHQLDTQPFLVGPRFRVLPAPGAGKLGTFKSHQIGLAEELTGGV